MITVKPIALDQVRWAIRACEEKRGMDFIATCFNACIERGEMDSAFHLPAGEYRRYAHLLADLVKIERQILNVLQGRDALTGEPLLNEEETREWSGESIERDHAEALEVEACRNLIARQARFVFHNTAAERAQAIEDVHAEALAENHRFDWLATRFAMFWGGCDNATRAEIIAVAWEQARHIIEAEVEAAHAEARAFMAELVEGDHAEALAMNEQYDLGAAMTADREHQIYFGRATARIQALIIDLSHEEALWLNECVAA